MLKDIIISILIGIAISQQFNTPDVPARLAIILIIAVTMFMVLLELEDMWDKRRQAAQRTRAIAAGLGRCIRSIAKRIRARIHWWLIQARTWPAERAQRRRRRRMMAEYIQQIQAMRRMPEGEPAQIHMEGGEQAWKK